MEHCNMKPQAWFKSNFLKRNLNELAPTGSGNPFYTLNNFSKKTDDNLTL